MEPQVPPDPPGQESIDDLPAPYQDPFQALGRDLRAVLATLKLLGRELWRRNRQGSLWRPGFWPGVLAPLFWPLLLALALGALIALPLAPAATARPEAAGSEGPVSAPAEPALAEEEAEADAVAQAVAEEVGVEVAIAELPPLAFDPLFELLRQDDPLHLIASAHPEPAAALLELRLIDRFALLPESERRAQADRWLERSRELGYERLLLLGPTGGLLGRPALVGSGMILLDPELSS